MHSSKNSVFVSKLHVYYVSNVIYGNYENYKKTSPRTFFFAYIKKKQYLCSAKPIILTKKMKRLLPWLVGFGLLAVVAVIAANIYDTVIYNAEEDEPAWVEPTDSTEYLDE